QQQQLMLLCCLVVLLCLSMGWLSQGKHWLPVDWLKRVSVAALCLSESSFTYETPVEETITVDDLTIKLGKNGNSPRASSPCNRTRVFVKTPFGDTLPADVDLAWTVGRALQHIFMPCGLKESEVFDLAACGLRFRGKHLCQERTLKACGAEIGSVLHLQLDQFSSL
ncbi:unnamed protein product, partial [Polarella glacialis]